MDGFDPYMQNVTFLLADGMTPINATVFMIDAFNSYSISVSINYGAQLGAAMLMLIAMLVMTPSAKLRRPSGILHVTILVLCIIRMALLATAFLSPFNEFYNHWAVDYSTIERQHYNASVAATTFSLLLVVFTEFALIYQAWTMVTLWPSVAKYVLCALSLCVTLLTISWRIAATVVQNRATMTLTSAADSLWIMKAAVITNAISICWFCAVFNMKLVIHLVTNRGVLPSSRVLSPMEVLVMTNGILMVVPVIFSGLEWGHFVNFESASLTLTSVAIILPLGTLAAQRVSQSYGIASAQEGFSYRGDTLLPATSNSTTPLKGFSSFLSSNRTNSTPGVSISSRCEASHPHRERLDPVDVELGRIDSTVHLHKGQVRIDHGIEQREERL
ncbi:unnamed protein product [Clonostachys chloroleuca]|uniref:Pheromone alpha factor receptor n=1 Tax=Clonostachys chloroleuca TaxID=1926264 RepID=A0AA35QCU7_9HYPO|nr:unnamed protein product [Clonostachys chloroleuca]